MSMNNHETLKQIDSFQKIDFVLNFKTVAIFGGGGVDAI